MALLQYSAARQLLRKAMPYVVGLLGLLITGWLAREVAVSDRERLEQRFQREAHEQAEAVIRPFADQLAIFEVLQRMFHTVGEIDETTFDRILDPLSRSAGLRGFSAGRRWSRPATGASSSGGEKSAGVSRLSSQNSARMERWSRGSSRIATSRCCFRFR